MNAPIYLVVCYVLVLIFISLFFVKKAVNSFEEYSLAGRSLSFVYIFLSYLGTWLSGGVILGLAASAFKWGFYQYWIIGAAYCFGFLTGPLFVTRIHKLKLYTLGDFFALRYPEHAQVIRILVSATIILRNITIIGAQLSAIGFLFMITLGTSFLKSVFMVMSIMVIYTGLSGLRGIVATDMIQGLLQAVGMPVLLFFIYHQAGGWNNIMEFYSNIGGSHYMNLFGGLGGLKKIAVFFVAPGLYFIFDDQTNWQRIHASQNDKVAFWGYLTPICAALLWLLFPCFIGVFGKVIFPHFTAFTVALFDYVFHLPTAVAALILVSFISAAMSTSDSYLLACGLTFSRDIYQKVFRPSASDHELIWASRLAILFTGLLAFSSCILIYDIFSLYISGAFLSGSIIVLPYLYTWFSRRMNSAGVIAGIIAGGTGFMIASIFLKLSNTTAMLIGLALNFLVSWSVALLCKKPAVEVVMNTYYWAPRFKGVKNIP
jgi:SSS family solute:Na+ symporter